MAGITYGIAWDDSLKLDNEEIDQQHKKLFELVSNLVSYCLDGSDTEKLQETLDFLVNYTVNHFYYEEKLQIQYNYPGYVKHKEMHENFKKTVGELVARFQESGSSADLSKDVNKIVVKWLINHIQREDKKIGDFLRTVENK